MSTKVEEFKGLENLLAYRLERWYRLIISADLVDDVDDNVAPVDDNVAVVCEYFTDYALATLRRESLKLDDGALIPSLVLVKITETEDEKKKRPTGFIIEGNEIRAVELSDEEKVKKRMQRSAMKNLSQADRYALGLTNDSRVTFPPVTTDIL